MKLVLPFNKSLSFLVITGLAISGCDLSAPFVTDSITLPSRYAEGEVIVAWKKDKSEFHGKPISKADLNRSFKAKSARILDNQERFIHLRLQAGEQTSVAMERLKGRPDVEFVQPNYRYRAFAVPNDTQYSRQWGLKNISQKVVSLNATQDSIISTSNPGGAGDDISAEAAWELITDCSSVVVAVLDTGAKLTHEDLVNNLWSDTDGSKGYDAVTGDNNPSDLFNGHGTHVSTTIGGEGNNGKGMAGVCWKAKIMPVRVLDDYGSGTTADIISGISFAVNKGAKIINMSLGGTGSIDLAWEEAVKTATNTLFIVAAGNGGADGVGDNNSVVPNWPCNFSVRPGVSNVICVGAVDQNFSISNYSNYSSTSVQISAPGNNIVGGSPTADVIPFKNWVGTADENWNLVSSALVNPSNYDGSTRTYANNLQSAVYTTLNFSTSTYVLAEFRITRFLELTNDLLKFGADRISGRNPFDPDNQTAAYKAYLTMTGDSVNDYSEYGEGWVDVSETCAGQASCTLGFQLQTNGSVVDYGVRITNIRFIGKADVNNSYMVISGTSMATPHVSGVAAMVWAYNPNYTLAEVKNAILKGGLMTSSLIGKNSTASVLNAVGSLAVLSKPSTPAVVAP